MNEQYALLSILVAQHGAIMTGGGGGSIVTAATSSAGGSSDSVVSQQQQQYHGYLGGATYLHCTLLADLLLSAGGPLPKAYEHVISLARVLDECVQEGTVSDKALVKIQSILKHIFHTDPTDGQDDDATTTTVGSATKKAAEESAARTEAAIDTTCGGGKKSANAASSSFSFSAPISSAAKRQLNRILTSAMSAMKMSDPQSLFLNDVTDEIAPGYSKIIKKPMCISAMEKKVSKNAYETLVEFER
jgi:Bromodomain